VKSYVSRKPIEQEKLTMMKDTRMNITYDFEGDDDDFEEIERWRRSFYPIETYPYFDDEYDDQGDKDCNNFW